MARAMPRPAPVISAVWPAKSAATAASLTVDGASGAEGSQPGPFRQMLLSLSALAVSGRTAAVSVDDKETAAEMAAKNKLTFPVGYGADAPAVAELTGAFVNPDPVYLQSTGFVLGPAGNVIVSVYSSGAIGRLVPDDVMGLVRYAREHAA